jgi:sugar phosphate isomerase/epimerase
VKNGSVKESFDLCKAWIRHAHVKDVGVKSSGKGYPFEEFFTLLKGINYTGFSLIEDSAPGDPVEFLKACRARWEKMAL